MLAGTITVAAPADQKLHHTANKSCIFQRAKYEIIFPK